MAEELQKHKLLVKLLKMTTSAIDAEALVAVRKANQLLAEAGWDWDKLMSGKITVVGDPFANLGDPLDGIETKTRAEPPWRPAPPPPPPPPPSPQPSTFRLPIQSTLSNKYEGACYCCGRMVAANGGFIFHPSDYHSRATKDWRVVCTTCNGNRYATVGPSPAPRVGRGIRKTTADDLA